MNRIQQIDKSLKKDKVILCGSGPSLDRIDVKALSETQDYDTMAIADAVKLLDRWTFAINYHYLGLKRIYNQLNRAKYFLLPDNIVTFKIAKEKRYKHQINERKMVELDQDIKNRKNTYFFTPEHLKYGVIKKGTFPLQFKKKIYHGSGSIVGALYFLINFMEYKNILYVGFDGCISSKDSHYSQVAFHPRKPHKELNVKIDYAQGWKEAVYLLKNYPKVKFLPLKDFMR